MLSCKVGPSEAYRAVSSPLPLVNTLSMQGKVPYSTELLLLHSGPDRIEAALNTAAETAPVHQKCK